MQGEARKLHVKSCQWEVATDDSPAACRVQVPGVKLFDGSRMGNWERDAHGLGEEIKIMLCAW
jgi:hypothetical protein